MNYEFTILALPAIVAGVFCIAVSFYVFSKNPKSEVNRMHSLLTLAAAIWSIGEGMLYLSAKANSLENVILWNNIEYLGISFIAPLWLHLSLIFPRKKKFSQHKLTFPLLYTYGALFYILKVNTNLMYENLGIENGIPTSSRLPLYWLFVGTAYLLLILGILSYLDSYLKEKISLKKKQAMIMISAGTLPFVGNIFYNTQVFLGGLPTLDLTPLFLGVAVVIFGYGILRYRLFDILPIALRGVVDNMRDGMIVVDLDGKIVDMNPAAKREIANQQIEGNYFLDVFKPIIENMENFEEVQRLIENIQKYPNQALEIELKLIKPKLRYFNVSFSPIKDKDETIGNLIVVRDITRIKRKELELEHANELKELFISIMSHDLRNPLQVIKGYSETAMMKSDHTTKKYFEKIKKSAKKIENIIGDARFYSRLRRSDYLENFERMDLGEIILESLEYISEKAREKKIDLLYNFSGNYNIFANPTLSNLFINLLDNAIKFSDKNSRVEIEIEDEGDYFSIGVKDQGIGVPNEYKEEIFEKFERREVNGKVGTGMGLTIAREIVRLHKGRIWVEDNKPQGSIFFVRFPKSF